VPRRGTAFALVLAVLAVLPAMFATTAAATTAGMFGINPGDLFRLPQAQWDTNLAAMSLSGIETVRMGAWWSDLEPAAPVDGRHTYSWSETDTRVAALARHGLRWAPLLAFTPRWASREGYYAHAPARADDFASFAAALAQRYGPGGTFWSEHPELPARPIDSYEIWNEQNAERFWYGGDAGTYADLYAAARTAVRRVDGSARVVVGGLAATIGGVTPADEFLRRMFAHRPDLRGNIDAVGFHPYARDVAGVHAAIAEFRSALDKIAGPGIPLELTEIGWTTTDVSEAARARMLGKLALTLPRSDCGIESIAPYAWVGPELDETDREQWFGIINPESTPKTSVRAYAVAIWIMRGFAGAAPTDTVSICAAAAPAVTPPPAPRTRTTRPRLRLLLRQDVTRPDQLHVATRCAIRCNFRVEMLEPVRATQAAHHVAGYRARRTVTLSLGRYDPGSRAKIKVTATTRDGREVRIFKTLSLR